MFQDAQAYDRFMGRWSALLAPPLVDFARLPASGKFLDVGSGTGALSNAIGRKNLRYRVIGVDPSKEYVDFAKSQHAVPGRVDFEEGDAQQLRFPDGDFDASLSLLVFNFIPDRAEALREVVRVTKSGGSVTAAVWDYGQGMRMLRVFWDSASATNPTAEKLDEKHMPLCHSGELSRFWKSGGLKQVEERPLTITMRFQSFADYWGPFLLGQGPAGSYAMKLEPKGREELRNDLKLRLGLSDEARPFSIDARAWAVRGLKA